MLSKSLDDQTLYYSRVSRVSRSQSWCCAILLFQVERNLTVSSCFQRASHISMSRVSLGVMSATLASSLERKRLRVKCPGHSWCWGWNMDCSWLTQAVWSSDDPLRRHTPSSQIILMMYAARESDSSLKSSPLIMRLDSVYSFRFFSNPKLVLFCTGIDLAPGVGICIHCQLGTLCFRSDAFVAFWALDPRGQCWRSTNSFRDLSSDGWETKLCDTGDTSTFHYWRTIWRTCGWHKFYLRLSVGAWWIFVFCFGDNRLWQ